MRSTVLTLAFLVLLANSQQIQAQDCNAAAAQASQLKSQVENLNARITRHQQAINNLNLDMRAEEVGDWVKLSQQAQDEARSHLLSAVLSSHPAFTGTQKVDPGLIRQLGSLTPYNIGATAKRWTGPLRGLGINTAPIESPLRQALWSLAKTKGKPKVAASLADSLASAFDKISLAVTMYEATSSFTKDQKWEAAGLVGSEILGAFVKTPTGALILTNANLFAANLYGGSMLVFKQRLNQVTMRTESDLHSVANIFRLMQQDVGSLQQTRQELSNANQVVNSSTCIQLAQEKTSNCEARCHKTYDPHVADNEKALKDCVSFRGENYSSCIRLNTNVLEYARRSLNDCLKGCRNPQK